MSEFFHKISDIDIFSISDFEIGQIDYPSGRTLGPRVQSGLQLVILDSGSVEIITDGSPVLLRPGEIACQWPGSRETFRFDRKQPSSHRWITISASNENALQKLMETKTKFPSIGSETNLMKGLFDLLINGPNSRNPEAADLTADPAWRETQAMFALAYLSAFANQVQSPSGNVEPKTRSKPLQKLKRFIDGNYEKKLTLEALANAASVAPSYLIRLCQKHYQITPMQWLWSVRIERGHDLLKNSALTIAEIAYKVGFSSPYHFSRMFKDKTGLTPTKAREIAWNSSLQSPGTEGNASNTSS